MGEKTGQGKHAIRVKSADGLAGMGTSDAICVAVKERNRPMGRILYTGRTRRAIIPLGAALLRRSSHLPACSDEPPFQP